MLFISEPSHTCAGVGRACRSWLVSWAKAEQRLPAAGVHVSQLPQAGNSVLPPGWSSSAIFIASSVLRPRRPQVGAAEFGEF